MGIETVAITSFGKNELQKYCTNSLYFYANETDTKKNDVISRVGMNIVTQLLIEYGSIIYMGVEKEIKKKHK